MARASKADAERHREEVIAATSKLVRTHGASGVSVPQAMAAAGLTHGGFYRHFSSKEDLVARACRAAFTERTTAMDDLTKDEFLAAYLSTPHRDNPHAGCAAAALAADASRAAPDDPLRESFTEGLRELADKLSRMDGATPGDDSALADLSAMVGALVLARACADEELSERILAAARARLLGTD
ncbi:TetR/AcrR family transcriptional regulator [Kitasatospora sp. NPDC101183]|uniref:TetR/AcrR family transcriptional regulator n=1 Tax=Kitasatospora sp. NPDC101183 TaxID=3364100 RepID=UPI00380C3BC8